MRNYFSTTKPIDYYAMYTGHNYQFLAMSRAMQGAQSRHDRRRSQLPSRGPERDTDRDARDRLVRFVFVLRYGPLRHVGRNPG